MDKPKERKILEFDNGFFEIREPKPLENKSKITMIAPSFGITTEPYQTRYLQAKKNLSKLGFEILEGENVHRNDGVAASASPKERADEFMKAYLSKTNALFSVGGGETMVEMLTFIDWDVIRKAEPKWFMGFSDNTNIILPLAILGKVASIYGPNAPSFYEKPLRFAQADALRILKGEKSFSGYPKWNKPKIEKGKAPENPLNKTRYNRPKKIIPFNYRKPFEGLLLGGCLDCLVGLCGTPYGNVKEFISQSRQGIVWYLEACDLTPMAYRRAIYQLKEAGWFSTAQGFLIGRPLFWEETSFGVNRFNAVKDILADLNVPILFDVDLGHYPPMVPIKNGAVAKISYTNGNIVYNYWRGQKQ